MDEVEIVEESDAGEELSRKALYLCAWEGHKSVALQEIEDALAEEICDYAYMISEVERVTQVYTLVLVGTVVEGESR
jgi:hypothetical protein